jgi:hypothetical protein
MQSSLFCAYNSHLSPYIPQEMFKNEILYENNILISIRITDFPFEIYTGYDRDIAPGLHTFMVTAGYMEIIDITGLLKKECNPVFHQFPGIEYFDIDRSALPVLLHAIVIHCRIMPQVMLGKIFVNDLKE